ncbi:MAG: SAM-dependent methyltransferase [Planctomycetes bacterium RBG_16_43_13]|nr:MAG: SAM-dependent methyltransferase [Planctomycetes bacterium RBG_16_43_13]
MNDKFMNWEEAVLWLKEQPEQVELVRACFYDDPLIKAAERYYQSTEWLAVRRLLPDPPGKVLDIGAGRGISSYALAKDGWETVALEPDSSSIVGAGAIRILAKEAGFNIRIEETWGEKLPFNDKTFDCVHGRQVLHHARDLETFCREVSRVLKKGGVFIATREHVISRREDLDKFLKNHPLHHLYGGENAYLLGEYISSIQGAGIRLSHILNPFQSDINLFPETVDGIKIQIAKKIRLTWHGVIPDILLKFLGERNSEPGRLYTFVGVKTDGK